MTGRKSDTPATSSALDSLNAATPRPAIMLPSAMATSRPSPPTEPNAATLELTSTLEGNAGGTSPLTGPGRRFLSISDSSGSMNGSA